LGFSYRESEGFSVRFLFVFTQERAKEPFSSENKQKERENPLRINKKNPKLRLLMKKAGLLLPFEYKTDFSCFRNRVWLLQ